MFTIENGELIAYTGNEENITIPEEVIIIKNLIFRNHHELRRIDLSNCKNLEKLATKTFFECRNLIEIILPEGLKEIGFQVFSNCQNLEIINIPETVEIIGSGSFEECMALVDIRIPKTVKKIEDYLFKNCAKLERVTLSDGLIYIGKGAFEGCMNLERIPLPETLKKISMFAFKDCRGLVAISIPRNIKVIERGCFWGCTRLVTVILPDSLELIDDYSFRECTSLTKLEYLSNVKVSPCAFLDSKTQNEPKYKDKFAVPKKKAKCYIATCVYKTYECEELWVLRRYRDDVLAKKWKGKLFIKVYYFFGPIIVFLFGKHKWFNKICKKKLDKFVKKIKNQGIENNEYKGK